jgi:hypothetical protein
MKILKSDILKIISYFACEAYSSTLKTEVVSSSEKSVNLYQTILHHNGEINWIFWLWNPITYGGNQY